MAVALSLSPIVERGLWMPGVSTKTTWTSSRLRTPRTSVRVVCGAVAVMLTFMPRMALSSVDLPTLGLPTRVAKPDFIDLAGSSRQPPGDGPAACVDGCIREMRTRPMRRPITFSAVSR